MVIVRSSIVMCIESSWLLSLIKPTFLRDTGKAVVQQEATLRRCHLKRHLRKSRTKHQRSSKAKTCLESCFSHQFHPNMSLFSLHDVSRGSRDKIYYPGSVNFFWPPFDPSPAIYGNIACCHRLGSSRTSRWAELPFWARGAAHTWAAPERLKPI